MNASRIHRLLKLITLLQTGQRFLADDLARETDVSRRTVFRDINLLKLAGIPLVYDEKDRRYTIEQSFYLPPVDFTLPEVLGLMLLARKRAAHTALPNADAIVSAVMKIESTLPRSVQTYCGSALELIDFRTGPAVDGPHMTGTFQLLWEAARNTEAVDITYDSFYEGEQIRTRIHPYRLTFVTRSWYVIGYSAMHDQTRTFKVERVIRASPTGERFDVDPDFDPAGYFGNAWRMIPGEKRHHVRIRFSPKVAGNVEEVLWHPTQQVSRDKKGRLLFEADVDGVEEIAWWVLGYGKEAVVEEPARLRQLILGHIKAMADSYNGSR